MQSTPEYYLRIAALGNFPTLPITKGDYEAIVRARQTLNAALNFEERFDLTLSNYIDLEKEILSLTLESMVNINYDYDRFYHIRSALNRRLTNFIISGTMYTKKIASDASKCCSNKEETLTAVEKLKSVQYDEHLDYRAMEALRNHISHAGLTVHTVRLPNQWDLDENKNAKELVFKVDMFAEKKILSENDGFKPSVLRELPELFDLKKASRTYISSISKIHEKTRIITDASIADARNLIERQIEAYSKINQEKTFAVGAHFNPPSSETKVKPVMLLLDWDDVRINLKARNNSLSNMDKRYISNSISIEKTKR